MNNRSQTVANPAKKAAEAAKKNRACPVCGQSSYSKDGIHPQCAVQLADESRKLELQAARKKASQSKAGQSQKRSWNKQCPKCRAQLHVRRKECDCGHVFSQTKSPA